MMIGKARFVKKPYRLVPVRVPTICGECLYWEGDFVDDNPGRQGICTDDDGKRYKKPYRFNASVRFCRRGVYADPDARKRHAIASRKEQAASLAADQRVKDLGITDFRVRTYGPNDEYHMEVDK